MRMDHSDSTARKITVFGNSWCADVRYTRRHLQKLAVPFDEIDIDKDLDAAQLVKHLTGFQRTPTLLIGSRILIEPDTDELEEALHAEGFID